MSESSFDPAQSLKIDLSRGQLTLAGSSGRILVPIDGLMALLEACNGEALSAFGATLGTDMGRRIAERLGSAIERATVELYLEHLGGELALTGLGNLTVERWGRALVLCVEGSSSSAVMEEVMSSLIEAAIQRTLSRDVAATLLSKEGGTLRFLLIGRHARAQVKEWLTAGSSLGDVLTKLHLASSANLSGTRGDS